MIGHLQTNKIKYIIDRVVLIHSIDSIHLAEAVNAERRKSTTGSCRFWWKSMWLRRRANPAF